MSNLVGLVKAITEEEARLTDPRFVDALNRDSIVTQQLVYYQIQFNSNQKAFVIKPIKGPMVMKLVTFVTTRGSVASKATASRYYTGKLVDELAVKVFDPSFEPAII